MLSRGRVIAGAAVMLPSRRSGVRVVTDDGDALVSGHGLLPSRLWYESDIIAMRRELRGRVCQCARACVCVRVSVKSVLTHVCLYIVAVCTLVGMHACNMCM